MSSESADLALGNLISVLLGLSDSSLGLQL